MAAQFGIRLREVSEQKRMVRTIVSPASFRPTWLLL